MKRDEFLLSLDELIDLEPGTLKGAEPLDGLEGWNSLAIIGFIALLDERLSLAVSPSRIAGCRTINDLISLAGERIVAGTD